MQYIILSFFSLSPTLAFAAEPENFSEILQILAEILGYAITLLYAGGVVIFLYGIGMFIWNTNNDADRQKGKQWMLWGVIGFFVALTLWGLVRILTGTFELGGEGRVFIPHLPERLEK